MMTTSDNMYEGDVMQPTEATSNVESQPQQPQQEGGMEDGGDVQSASNDVEQPIQEMEDGGEVDDGRLILDWGYVFTFFK